MSDSDSNPDHSSRLGRAAVWILAGLPAWVTLVVMWPLRAEVPFADGWAMVEQYQAWMEGRYGWLDFFTPHNQHPSAPGKALYLTALHWGKGEVALLPLVTWGMGVIVSLALLGMLRRCRVVSSPGLPWAWLGVNLLVFSLAQGTVWNWEFLVFNAVPGTALVLGLALLTDGVKGRWGLKVALSSLLGLVAVFGFGSGLVVPFLLLPAVVLSGLTQADCRRGRVVGVAVIWTGGMVLAALIAFGVIGPIETPYMPSSAGRLREIMETPLDKVQFVLIVMGRGMGQGSVLDPVVQSTLAGLLLMGMGSLALVGLVRAGGGLSVAILARIWPWLALVGWAVANALLICWGRAAESQVAALDQRYVAFSVYGWVGVLGLLMLAYRRLVEMERGLVWVRAMVWVRGPCLGFLGLLTMLASLEGWQSMRVDKERMLSVQGSLAFARVLPLDAFQFWRGISHFDGQGELALFLHEHDRLRKVGLLDDKRVARAKLLAPLVSSKGRLRDLECQADGTWRLKGWSAWAEGWAGRPSLIAVSFAGPGREEQWVAIGSPNQVDDFYQNEWLRLRYREHYFGWECVIPASVSAGLRDGVLRAYGYDARRRAFRLIGGRVETDGLPANAPIVRLALP